MLTIGTVLKDNDPRVPIGLRLVVIGYNGDGHVICRRGAKGGRHVKISVKRIYTDDKPRKSGFSVVTT